MLSQAMVVQSLRSLRDIFFEAKRQTRCSSDATLDVTGPSLDNLSVDMQFYIMSFLSPQDLCRLGATCTYWRLMVRDPVLWKFFLCRDLPLWPSVDHLSLPQVDSSGSPLQEDSEMSFDYMAEYLRVCPASRDQWRQQPKAPFDTVTSFFHSLIPVSAEPQLAMFGPGLEQLEVSLMNVIMHSSHILPIAGIPQRQFDGIGSGISFKYDDKHTFNIVTLYSTNSTERERARLEQLSLRSKIFLYQEESESNIPLCLNPVFYQVCQAVSGFIFVANAEKQRGTDKDWEEERAQIRVMLDRGMGASSRPLLVLSCVSRETAERPRTPCVTMAHQLQLSALPNPWMVQDTAAETLRGLLDGIKWLLRHSGVRL